MTDLEREAVNLYREGRSKAEIADTLGVHKTFVSGAVKRFRDEYTGQVHPERGGSIPCPWSPSCFTCRLQDCEIPVMAIFQINRLPDDMELFRLKREVGE